MVDLYDKDLVVTMTISTTTEVVGVITCAGVTKTTAMTMVATGGGETATMEDAVAVVVVVTIVDSTMVVVVFCTSLEDRFQSIPKDSHG